MGAFLLLALVLQSSLGCFAQRIHVEYDPLLKNFSIIYEENDEFFPSEMYYFENSTYNYDNHMGEYYYDTASPDDWSHTQNFADPAGALLVCHNLTLCLSLLPLLWLLQPAGRI